MWLQVPYKLVFFLEYLGPFLIYPMFWANDFRSGIYKIGSDKALRQAAQNLACVYWCAHYAKVRFRLLPPQF